MSQLSSPRVQRLPAVLAQTGMGRSLIYREIAAGRFPAPLKLGRASGWLSSDIDAWLAQLDRGETGTAKT